MILELIVAGGWIFWAFGKYRKDFDSIKVEKEI